MAMVEPKITHPATGDFFQGASVERDYQRQKWKATDPEKSDADWFWTLSYIVGKVLWPGISTEKKLHRIEAAAGMLANWHQAVKEREGVATLMTLRFGIIRPSCGQTGEVRRTW